MTIDKTAEGSNDGGNAPSGVYEGLKRNWVSSIAVRSAKQATVVS